MYLKTCPFCGGKPYLEKASRGFVGGQPAKVCYVRCKSCNARSERVNIADFGHTSYSGEAIKQVAEAWNSRVDNTELVFVQENRSVAQ